MKILVVSVETGSAQVKGRAENWSETGRTSGRIETGAPASSPIDVGIPARRRTPSLLVHSHSDHGRSRQSLGHPTDLPPRMHRSSALASNRAPSDRPEGCLDSGKRRETPPSPTPSSTLHSLCRSRFHTTRYRTTHFDNLRRTWKSRMYWEYTKTSDLVNPKSKARAKLSCRLKGLIG